MFLSFPIIVIAASQSSLLCSISVRPICFGPGRLALSCSYQDIISVFSTNPTALWSEGTARVLRITDQPNRPMVLVSRQT